MIISYVPFTQYLNDTDFTISLKIHEPNGNSEKIFLNGMYQMLQIWEECFT